MSIFKTWLSDFKGANSNPQEFFYKVYFPPEYHQPCSGGGACVIPQPWELYWRKLQFLSGLTKPGRSKGRIQTNRWSNRWQQGEGSAHRQIQPGVFWLRVTVVLGRTSRLLVGLASINSQISNRKKVMTNNMTQNSCRIDCHADKQESRHVVPGMAADEKLANTKQKIPMLKSKQTICIPTLMCKL